MSASRNLERPKAGTMSIVTASIHAALVLMLAIFVATLKMNNMLPPVTSKIKVSYFANV